MLGSFQLRDPDRKIPFSVYRQASSEQLLTGWDASQVVVTSRRPAGSVDRSPRRAISSRSCTGKAPIPH